MFIKNIFRRTHAGNFTTLPQYFKEYGYRSSGAVVTWLAVKTTSPITVHCYNDDCDRRQPALEDGEPGQGVPPGHRLQPQRRPALQLVRPALPPAHTGHLGMCIMYRDLTMPMLQEYKNAPVCPDPATGGLHSNVFCPVQVSAQPGAALPDIQTTEQAEKFLEEHSSNNNSSSGQPFLLAVGLHKPHIPHKFPEEFLRYHPYEVK